MQPQLTDCARSSLDSAQAEARALNQEFVGTEHLFLGLLKSNGCLSRTLKAQHIDRDRVRARLIAQMSHPSESPIITGQLPLSPKAQRALNSSVVMAMSLREPRVSTRVMMLSLMEDPSNPFDAALRDGGGDIDLLRRALAEKPTQPET